MRKKVIITGATGMIGKGILLECLDHIDIEQVLVIGRSTVDIKHPKLKELIHKDFSDFSTVSNALVGYDACFYSLGISAAGLSEEKYTEISYNYTLSLAKTLLAVNPKATFNYVSGVGTDSTEKGRMMWARVKGKTENDLLKLGFKDAYMFRPGMLIPLKGIKTRTKGYQFMYDYFMWLVKLIKILAPNSVVFTTQLGMAMINSLYSRYPNKVVMPKDMIVMATK